MYRHLLIGSAVALSLSAFSPTVRADDVNAQDKHFVAAAATGGMLEAELGQYASENGSEDGVKKFGQRMNDDHTKMADELKSTAKDESVHVPGKLTHEQTEEKDRLEKLKGPDFDKAYMAAMVEDHQKTISVFEKEVNDGSDGKLKALAEKAIPSLKEHLQMAEDLKKKVGE
jgi:putative membrane protein